MRPHRKPDATGASPVDVIPTVRSSAPVTDQQAVDVSPASKQKGPDIVLPLDVDTNRATRSWSRRENAGRITWALATPFFALSPRPAWAWRNWLLRCFGARVGRQVHIFPSVRITIPWNLTIGDQSAVGDRAILYALGPISLGARATVSQGVHLCAGTHDWRRPDRPLVKASISIGDDAWIAADAFVGPHVSVGARAIVGARAVVTKSIPEDVIVVGNPASPISRTHSAERESHVADSRDPYVQ